jgi:ubiquinone/menaquinone biosynthesis C-methylase UbiE
MSIPFGSVASEVYERNMGRWSRRLAPLLLDFVADESKPHRLLDVGCGTGSLTLVLAERFPSAIIIGADVSEELLGLARSKNSAPDRVQFETGDVRHLPYEANAFGLTLSNLVLNFIPDANAAVREMVRVTQPGGTVAATIWDLRGGLPHVRLLLDTAAAVDEGAIEYRDRFYSGPGVRPGELAEMWHAAGLKDVRDDTLATRMEFQSFSDYWEPTEQSGLFGTYLRGLSENRRDLIREKVRAAYLMGDEDGYRSFTATAWAAKGKAP